jgi:aryl-alcohol dehydrogenase-like predicted oxidoreductase
LHRQPEVNGLLDACQELGIALIAYQPLAMGVLTGKYRPGDRPKGIRRYDRYFRGGGLEKAQPVVALLGEIGERHSKTPAQVALRWLIEQDGVLPIPGAKNGSQAAGNAEALSLSLDAAEIQALDRATTAWRR